ncbi:MAG: hypothetical protein ACPG3V_05925 [Porticoccaceae bacterium]
MNKAIEEQTDSLESIISEVTKVNELVYAGWSVESLSRGVTKDNIEDICALLNRLSSANLSANLDSVSPVENLRYPVEPLIFIRE